MLKNVYFAFCMTLGGSLLCVGDVIGSQNAPVATPKRSYFIPHLITVITSYCMPSPELNLIVNTNNKETKKTSTPANPRDVHFELLFLRQDCFRLNRLTHCQNHDVDYFYTDVEQNPHTGRWARIYTHQATIRTKFGANDQQYQEEIACLNVIEKNLGKPDYQHADLITRHGITSSCTIWPYDNGTVGFELNHDTRALFTAVNQALNAEH